MSEPLPFYSAGVNEDKPIVGTIEELKLAVEHGLFCTLTAGQCADLLAEIAELKDYISRVGDIRAGLSREVEAQIILSARKPLFAEIERLERLLADERDMELPF